MNNLPNTYGIPNKYDIPNISSIDDDAINYIDIYLERLNEAGIEIELYKTANDYIFIYRDMKLPRVKNKLKKYFTVFKEEGGVGGMCCVENAGEPNEYVSIDIAKSMIVYQISIKDRKDIINDAYYYKGD